VTGGLPTASVVIPTRNRRRLLERTLAPFRGDPAVHEVVVVDDGSTDGTWEWLAAEAAHWPALRPVQGPGLGPGRAREVGVAAATGEVVIFLDDDEIARDGLVDGHCRHHRDRPKLVVEGYYPTIIDEHSTAGTRYLARVYEESVAVIAGDESLGLQSLWGGNFSARRDDIAELTVSVPEFEHHKSHEDRELGVRCLKAGFAFVLDRGLHADHLASRTMSQFRRDRWESGYGEVVVHMLHEDVLGPLPRVVLESTSTTVTRLLRLTDRPAVYRLVADLFSIVASTSEALRLSHVADIAIRVVARIEIRQGARAALAVYRQSSVPV